MLARLCIAAAAALGAAPALACQCEDPASFGEAERANMARVLAVQAVTIAEVERIGTVYEERYRVIRYLAGERPAGPELRVREPVASPFPPAPRTSCDYSAGVGQKAIVAFVRPGLGWVSAQKLVDGRLCGPRAALAIADLHTPGRAGPLLVANQCTQYFLQAPGNLKRVLDAARKMSRPTG
jgi:hypothetical protein